MAATAEKSGKNPDIARGMVDEELSFEYLVVEGDTLQVDDIEGRTGYINRIRELAKGCGALWLSSQS